MADRFGTKWSPDVFQCVRAPGDVLQRVEQRQADVATKSKELCLLEPTKTEPVVFLSKWILILINVSENLIKNKTISILVQFFL